MIAFSKYIGEEVELELSSKIKLRGILIDLGTDIIVLYDGNKYIYLPSRHLQYLKQNEDNELEFAPPSSPHTFNDNQAISLRNILNNAKGSFVEVYVTSNQSLYGYILNVLNNYLVFYSPVYKTVYIPLHHLKWLIPYQSDRAPYALSTYSFPVQSTNLTLARTLEQQIKKLKGQMVIFDLGNNPSKIGVLQDIQDNIVELTTGKETVYWNFYHIKTIHWPDS